MKKVFLLVVVIVFVIFSIYKIDEINNNKTHNLKIYSNNNIEWKSVYINEEIYADEFWEQIVNLYSNDVSKNYIKFSEDLEWKDSGIFPEGQADEVVIVSKGSVGLVSWKAWINEDTKKVVLHRYPNKKIEIDLSLYQSLPRRKGD